MEATVSGSGGIPLDRSLETGRGKEKNLKKRRLVVPVATRDRDETGAKTRRKEDFKTIF